MDRPWYRHYDPGVPRHLQYPNITLPEMLGQTAARHPARTATLFHGRSVSYQVLQREVEAFAANLRALGVRHGERVALVLPNVPQFLVAFFGSLRAGSIVVPTNPLYTRRELEHQLADAGVTAAITLDQLFPRVQEALPATSIRTVVVAGIDEALPRRVRPLYAVKRRREGIRRIRPGGIVHRYEELITPGGPAGEPRAGPDDVAILQYTGGTTGRAKGAMLTHRSLIANALQAQAWQGLRTREHLTILCVIPFFHVYGLTIAMNMAVAGGSTMVLLPRWVAADVARAARTYRPQVFPGVPTMYAAIPQMEGHPERDFASLEICMSGAAPLHAEVQERFESLCGARVVEGYGLTEAGPVTHCNPVQIDRRAGTVGIPFPDTDASITDPDTWQPLPAGQVGELTVRGPQVMKGYWNRPEETLAVLRDGWLHTGDLATMDEEGYVRIVDRKKDLIIAGGYNVYPREVEDVLLTHPKIEEAAVIGVHSAYRGETVKAVVVVRDGGILTSDEIVAFCHERLAAYKIPRIVEFREELPRTLVGKVLRRKLREEVLQPSARQLPA